MSECSELFEIRCHWPASKTDGQSAFVIRGDFFFPHRYSFLLQQPVRFANRRSIEYTVPLLTCVRAFLERVLSERYNRDALYVRLNGMSSNKINL